MFIMIINPIRLKIPYAGFDSTESFDPELFDHELTTEGLAEVWILVTGSRNSKHY